MAIQAIINNALSKMGVVLSVQHFNFNSFVKICRNGLMDHMMVLLITGEQFHSVWQGW